MSECELRVSQRVRAATRLQVIWIDALNPTSEPRIGQGWSEDVSLSGARLLVPAELTADRFWLRLWYEDAEESFIECVIRWEGPPTTASAGLRGCGVEFGRTLTRAEFDRWLARARRSRQQPVHVELE